jgi:ABC-2 type transport system ATP-binding protein
MLNAESPYLGQSPAVGLTLDHVSKKFRSLAVLSDVSLSVAMGEVVSLVGPNGSGKTTLLRIIIGTVTPDSGSVHVAGFDIRKHPAEVRASVSCVLGDEHGWYWRLSGRDNLIFFGRLRGLSSSDAATNADHYLEKYGLSKSATQRVGEYSTGMRGRLAIARAMLSTNPVIVLDEPTRGLDPGANDLFIESLAASSDRAILLVTHDLEIVARISTRSVLLSSGHVVAELPGDTDLAVLSDCLKAVSA